MIDLDTPLTKGKYKGKSINEIQDHFYICWILNNWQDKFSDAVHKKYDYDAYIAAEYNYGSEVGGGITLEDCEKT